MEWSQERRYSRGTETEDNEVIMQVGKVYYSMREATAETGLSVATLRYWEQQFEQLNPRKDGHGNRYYTEADLALIKRIRYIRDELKITRIEAIRSELLTDSRKTDSRARATEILLRLKKDLEEIRASI